MKQAPPLPELPREIQRKIVKEKLKIEDKDSRDEAKRLRDIAKRLIRPLEEESRASANPDFRAWDVVKQLKRFALSAKPEELSYWPAKYELDRLLEKWYNFLPIRKKVSFITYVSKILARTKGAPS